MSALLQASARALLLEIARTSGRPLLEIARQILDRTTDPTR